MRRRALATERKPCDGNESEDTQPDGRQNDNEPEHHTHDGTDLMATFERILPNLIGLALARQTVLLEHTIAQALAIQLLNDRVAARAYL